MISLKLLLARLGMSCFLLVLKEAGAVGSLVRRSSGPLAFSARCLYVLPGPGSGPDGHTSPGSTGRRPARVFPPC